MYRSVQMTRLLSLSGMTAITAAPDRRRVQHGRMAHFGPRLESLIHSKSPRPFEIVPQAITFTFWPVPGAGEDCTGGADVVLSSESLSLGRSGALFA
jgi:hypothetical protein